MVLYFTRPATINPMCPGTVFLRSIPKNHNFSSDSAVRNGVFFFGKKVPWLNKLVESLLLQQSISKQTADVELSRLHFGQDEVIVDVKGMISKRFPKPYACHLKKFFSQQDEAVVFRLESPKKKRKT